MFIKLRFYLQAALIVQIFSTFLLLILLPSATYSQPFSAHTQMLWQGDTSLIFRGISALNDQVVWVSGNFGTVVKTTDGGNTWTVLKVKGAETLQFRDIHVFDEKTALIMGSGWPTRIYKTVDGGQEWRLVYENNDSAVFLNSFDFWPDGSGLCFGDPVNGSFFLLKTINQGADWFEISGPEAVVGEAGFAASGTSLVCFGAANHAAMFVTGGKVSHIFLSPNRGESWVSQPSGFLAGKPSQGIFGIAHGGERFVFVGGDYLIPQIDSLTVGAIFFIKDDITGSMGAGLPYQSGAVLIADFIAISAGTPGCHRSDDGGLTWKKFTDMPLHTITKARKGSALYAAGPKGAIVKISVVE